MPQLETDLTEKIVYFMKRVGSNKFSFEVDEAGGVTLQFLPGKDGISSPMPFSIQDGKRPLTRRELEVASLVAEGMSNRSISVKLELQEQSVKNLVSGIMRKLDCENRVQVALKMKQLSTDPAKAE